MLKHIFNCVGLTELFKGEKKHKHDGDIAILLE
jgi:hypothetical protein